MNDDSPRSVPKNGTYDVQCAMMPEIIARVSAWLDAHEPWILATPARWTLAAEWKIRVLTLPHGQQAGINAILLGLLLALVREAWPGCIQIDERLAVFGDGRRFAIEVRPRGVGSSVFHGRSLEEALATALLAAELAPEGEDA